MKIRYYKRNEYKFLPMDILREICIYKQKQISYSSYFLVTASVLIFAFCGILGWVTFYTSVYGGMQYMTPSYILAIVFSVLFIIFGSGIRAESRFFTTVCLILFGLLILVGFYVLIFFSNKGEMISSLCFIIIGIIGMLYYSTMFSCFEDMDELRKLDGYPRFMELSISKDDFEHHK